MRNIIFNEHTFFDNKSEFLFSQMIIKMNSLIIKVRLSEAQITNKCLLEEDEKILKSSFDLKDNESDNEEVITFDKKKDYKLVRALENALLTSSFSEIDIKIIFHI